MVDTVNTVGCVIVTVVVTVQPLLSVTVTVQIPAVNPVTVAVDCAGTGSFHRYVYASVPPAPVAMACPLLPPLHDILVCVVVTVSTTGWVITAVCVAVQPLASVTVTVQVPAVNPVTVAVDCAGAGSFHTYVYADTPPAGVAIACPLLPPLHDMFVGDVLTVSAAAGWVIVTVLVAVQPLLSVTVTVQVAAVNPVTVCVDCAGAGSFHTYV